MLSGAGGCRPGAAPSPAGLAWALHAPFAVGMAAAVPWCVQGAVCRGVPAVRQVHALVVGAEVPAVGAGHVQAGRRLHAHLDGLAEHRRPHGHLPPPSTNAGPSHALTACVSRRPDTSQTPRARQTSQTSVWQPGSRRLVFRLVHGLTGAAQRPARQRRVGRGQARARPGQQVQDALAQQARVENLRAGPRCAAHVQGLPRMCHVGVPDSMRRPGLEPPGPSAPERIRHRRVCIRPVQAGRESGHRRSGCPAHTAAAASVLQARTHLENEQVGARVEVGEPVAQRLGVHAAHVARDHRASPRKAVGHQRLRCGICHVAAHLHRGRPVRARPAPDALAQQ